MTNRQAYVVRAEYELGQYVRDPRGDVGKIVGIVAVPMYTVEYDDHGHIASSEHLETSLQPAPKPTQAEAWAQVPLIAIRFANAHEARIVHFINEHDFSAIRHDCYVLLGGAEPRVKITDEVKAQVRRVVEEALQLIGWRVYEGDGTGMYGAGIPASGW